MQRPAAFACAVAALAIALAAAACGSDSNAGARGGVTIEPVVSVTSVVAVPTGGKPAAPPTSAVPTDIPAIVTATGEPEAAATDEPAASATEAPAATATSVPPLTSDGSSAPTEGRWIDVDVTTFAVRLMDGASVVREIAPVAVGEQVDTGEYASTQTGLFYVNSKVEDLVYDPPYDTYISHWVGFDADKANGFHSFLKDEDGNVVDPRTG
ncbi:MAG: hypothetical protein AAB349_01130, partial [Chloroflexota bacterium]